MDQYISCGKHACTPINSKLRLSPRWLGIWSMCGRDWLLWIVFVGLRRSCSALSSSNPCKPLHSSTTGQSGWYYRPSHQPSLNTIRSHQASHPTTISYSSVHCSFMRIMSSNFVVQSVAPSLSGRLTAGPISSQSPTLSHWVLQMPSGDCFEYVVSPWLGHSVFHV